MSDTPEKALREAEGWLVSAKHGLAEAQSDEAISSVCCAQAIHAIIRANDALCLKFFGYKPTRHDDAAVIFAKLLREGKLPSGAEPFRNLVARAMRDKSGADYGKRTFGYGEASDYAEESGKFVAMAKDALARWAGPENLEHI